MTHDLSARLRRLRREHDLSLRGMAARLSSEGHSVSHDSVRQYENGRQVPAEYVLAVSSAFDASLDWLLLGQGAMRPRRASEADEALETVTDILKAYRNDRGDWITRGWARAARRWWSSFVAGLGSADPVQKVSVKSWMPSGERTGGDPGEEQRVRRVGKEETDRRAEVASVVVDGAQRHRRWLALLLRDVPHAVSLLDAEGIVIRTETNDREKAREWNAEPGVDWSESAMGPNGGGSALVLDRLSVVIGGQGRSSFHDFACLGAPLHDPRGSVVGALSLSVGFPDAQPERMMSTAYAAEQIDAHMAGAQEGRVLDSAVSRP